MPDASNRWQRLGMGIGTRDMVALSGQRRQNQKKNPCIVPPVPSFDGPDAAVNDNWETSDEVKVTEPREYIASNYKVDRNRIYTTG